MFRGPCPLVVFLCAIAMSVHPNDGCTFAQENAATEIAPWPQNRIRDFYAKSAERFLSGKQPIPELLPAFPGLDGGTFGHWGHYPQNRTTNVWIGDVKYDGMMTTMTEHFGATTPKAIQVQPGAEGDMTALFDPAVSSFVDVWDGRLAKFKPFLMGLVMPVVPRGEQLVDLHDSDWNVPEQTNRQFLGLYRHGRDVVFRYNVGDANVLDHAWKTGESFARTIQGRRYAAHRHEPNFA